MAVRHLIVTIHQYWPLELTFQGEEWFTQGDVNAWRGTGWAGMQEQRGQLAAGFQQLADWAPARDRPIFVGEFGSSNNAEMASRARWTRTNRELAEPHGFSWGYWSFGPSFALYDLNANRWNRQLLDALST